MCYSPQRGDIVWLDFNPQVGREQANRRPALILSPLDYNSKVRLALVCPITNQIKGYPFEVRLPNGLDVKGVVLADQVKSFDWQLRKAEFICKAPDAVLSEVVSKISALLL